MRKRGFSRHVTVSARERSRGTVIHITQHAVAPGPVFDGSNNIYDDPIIYYYLIIKSSLQLKVSWIIIEWYSHEIFRKLYDQRLKNRNLMRVYESTTKEDPPTRSIVHIISMTTPH